MARTNGGIFCVEGDWSHRLSDGISVRPMLALLEDTVGIPSIHRSATVGPALADALHHWVAGRHAKYHVGYLAFHGSPGSISLGANEHVSLEQLGEMLHGRCAGKVVHFGACGTVRVTEARLREFQELTGAWAVSGFTKQIDWLESAAFDLLYLRAAATASRITRLTNVARRYPGLADRVGFRLHHV